MDNKIPKDKAHQKFDTSKPGTIELAKSTRRALITRENNPKVRIFIGRVSKTRTGFSKALISPKTKATSTAVPNPATDTPGRTAANIKITTALTNKFKIKLMIQLE